LEADPHWENTPFTDPMTKSVGSAVAIMAWGNGACAADGNAFIVLTEIVKSRLPVQNGPIG
jgi:hypothetical protein